jgi:hypothetical protein
VQTAFRDSGKRQAAEVARVVVSAVRAAEVVNASVKLAGFVHLGQIQFFF